MDLVTLALAKKYTEETAEQFGAVKGANCQVGTIADITSGGKTIGVRMPVFWKNDDDETESDNVDIMYEDIADMVLSQLPVAEEIEV